MYFSTFAHFACSVSNALPFCLLILHVDAFRGGSLWVTKPFRDSSGSQHFALCSPHGIWGAGGASPPPFPAPAPGRGHPRADGTFLPQSAPSPGPAARALGVHSLTCHTAGVDACGPGDAGWDRGLTLGLWADVRLCSFLPPQTPGPQKPPNSGCSRVLRSLGFFLYRRLGTRGSLSLASSLLT